MTVLENNSTSYRIYLLFICRPFVSFKMKVSNYSTLPISINYHNIYFLITHIYLPADVYSVLNCSCLI